MTLHLIDIGTPATVRPTRLRSIVAALKDQTVDPEQIVAVGTATGHARAAGLEAGRVIGVRPSARRLARWTHGHGRVVAWGEWTHGVPDGVAWAPQPKTSWDAVPPSTWSPEPGAPLVLWCGEPATSTCALTAIEVVARLALLGCSARVVVAAGAARLDRARAMERDMQLGAALIVLDDHAALATIAAHAAVAVAASDNANSLATRAAVPECLAAFAAAGTACLATQGSANESWVLTPREAGIGGLALSLADLLGSPHELNAAGARARAAAESHREPLLTN
ncbi:MAG: hypothetical protein FJ254_02240 [Phycisphaerae bacterium]|nr:hypothetical protein [Phycisphaerae bacterium]